MIILNTFFKLFDYSLSLWNIILNVLFSFLFTIVPILISVAFLTLLERKILASIQRRRGPSVVGLFGILQPFADGLKLFIKENIVPSQSDKIIFIMAPIMTFSLSLMGWAILPIGGYFAPINLKYGLLFLFAISSLAVYGIILAGWSSNSKYSLLGSLRSAAQMVSYEVSIGLILITLLLCTGSLNLTEIILYQKTIWFVFVFFPIFLMFFISALAETNRPPFDLPEAEAELVAGYNVEYSAIGFAFFFIGEYANIMLMSSLCVIFFFGGWLPIIDYNFFYNLQPIFWFIIKFILFLYLFICVRAALPRYRYDQLMKLGWKILLPLSLGYLIFLCGILFSFEYFPLFILI
jgi:NADH-quinone oxidoreductase subunit H